jgi:hypothetical protein
LRENDELTIGGGHWLTIPTTIERVTDLNEPRMPKLAVPHFREATLNWILVAHIF